MSGNGEKNGLMKNIFSVDVEELFHTEYSKNAKVDKNLFRTPQNISTVLRLLDKYDYKATFFVVGQVAEKFPHLLKELSVRGHEVAFHSYDHVPLWLKTERQLEQEIADFNRLLSSVIGKKCMGFRAPSFSLDNRTKWAVSVLKSLEIGYDSSIFPAWTPLYGLANAPSRPYKIAIDNLTRNVAHSSLWEFPLATYQFLKYRIPAAGGFYLRLFPHIVKCSIDQLNKQGVPAVIFVHNWELDSRTPRFALGLYKSFVTYHNLSKTETFLNRLFATFEFTSFADYLETQELD
jgi:polysaccharide deacetylase family protein (PEP-CTERM system associated)